MAVPGLGREGEERKAHDQWTRTEGQLYTRSHILLSVFCASARWVDLLPECSKVRCKILTCLSPRFLMFLVSPLNS